MNLEVIQVGVSADELLKKDPLGTSMGATSKGMFLKAEKRILFVTDTAYKSPFNIQVASMKGIETQIQPGDPWRCENGQITLKNGLWRFNISRAPVWQPTDPPPMDLSPVQGKNRLEALFEIMLKMDPSKGWLFLRQRDHAGMDDEKARIIERVRDFLSAVASADKAAALENARSIMGRGGGLTPSGDDWLSGFFLFFKRAKMLNPFLSDLGLSLVNLAFERTTLISANRLEAALKGWAEELFLDFSDHLINLECLFPAEKVPLLVNFGHSSGVDTCLGIEAALTIIADQS